MHDELACTKDLAILRNLDLHSAHGWADRVHAKAGLGPVAAHDRSSLGLPVALQHGKTHRLEEIANIRVKRRAA